MGASDHQNVSVESLSQESPTALTERGHLGPAFLAGVLIDMGSASYHQEDRLHVMAADRLWTAN